MSKQTHVLIEKYIGHQLEVSFYQTPNDKNLKFIPDDVKEIILDQLSDKEQGEFGNSNTGFEGTWRIIKLSHSLLHRVSMLMYNFYQHSLELKETDFIKWFGEFDGTNLFERWVNYYKCDFLRMVTHFGPSGYKGQIFCDMVMDQLIKYEQLNT